MRTNVKKSACVALCAILVVGCCLLCGCASSFVADDCLSKEQVELLRKDYPIISEGEMQFDVLVFSWHVRKGIIPLLARVKIVKELPEYSVEVWDDTAEPWDKTANISLAFRQFIVEVQETYINKSDLPVENTEIVISFAKFFEESYPVFRIGEEMILSLDKAKGSHEGTYLMYDNTAYYIVDDAYVISAYDEPAGDTFTGMKLDALSAIFRAP